MRSSDALADARLRRHCCRVPAADASARAGTPTRARRCRRCRRRRATPSRRGGPPAVPPPRPAGDDRSEAVTAVVGAPERSARRPGAPERSAQRRGTAIATRRLSGRSSATSAAKAALASQPVRSRADSRSVSACAAATTSAQRSIGIAAAITRSKQSRLCFLGQRGAARKLKHRHRATTTSRFSRCDAIAWPRLRVPIDLGVRWCPQRRAKKDCAHRLRTCPASPRRATTRRTSSSSERRSRVSKSPRTLRADSE